MAGDREVEDLRAGVRLAAIAAVLVSVRGSGIFRAGVCIEAMGACAGGSGGGGCESMVDLVDSDGVTASKFCSVLCFANVSKFGVQSSVVKRIWSASSASSPYILHLTFQAQVSLLAVQLYFFLHS